MDLSTKLKILGEGARYDVSCSSSGSSGVLSNSQNGYSIGNTAISGICHSWSEDGRCISLLKVLLTNHCEYDCLYCINRKSNDIPRAFFSPKEIAEITIEFYKRNYIEGLFLSSGVIKSPDYTMDLLIQAVTILRTDYSFGGYIHVKTIPGASDNAVYQLGLLVDRISVNMEFSSQESFKVLTPQKNITDIIKPMELMKNKKLEFLDYSKNKIAPPSFIPGGQSTQFIVGARPESDYRLLSISQKLYTEYSMKRVYYSAYIPVNSGNNLPAITTPPPLLREHRLYQADWLMRFYKFDANEILSSNMPFLDLEVDPKCNWAINNFDVFPVEINRADYITLLRVPGIGVLSAKKIIAARKYKSISYEDAKKIGIVLKRAVYFLTFNGRYYAGAIHSLDLLKNLLADKRGKQIYSASQMRIEDIKNVLSV